MHTASLANASLNCTKTYLPKQSNIAYTLVPPRGIKAGVPYRSAQFDLGTRAGNMLSLYRAWLGPGPCVARPAPPPGAHRPVPRRARPTTPPPESPPPPSPGSTTSSELDVERIEEPVRQTSNAVLDVASCDGPVRFSRVLNVAWRESSPDRGWPCRHRKTQKATLHYYPCKTCGCKFPSYYFVHKHRKRCHAEEPDDDEPAPSTSKAAA